MKPKVKKPESKEMQEERRKEDVKKIQEAKRKDGARKLQEAKRKPEAEEQREAKKKRKAKKRGEAIEKQKSLAVSSSEITDLEEDVLLYGICNARLWLFFSRSNNRIELLSVIKDHGIKWWRKAVRMSDVTENCKITKKNQISGVISSLSKKGLVKCGTNNQGEKTITLTVSGVWVLKNI